ncbi:hypothetical protein AT746_13655 [Lacimicrobium alkaliphilum]|uniref:Lipid/polyisoprenoid-binding YceI-like domain-containing protein n=2 Tax=Lacimicrobium alkaliphilum TaxID=1526571 RepID=A0A0U3AYL4_9ALTE|nr:hypothetical protein AT746_13655 [Lacimicrobium alkaliphilum]
MSINHFFKLLLGTTLTLSLIALSANANTLQGSLNGKQQSWHILQRDDMSTASYTELSPGMLTVTLQGHSEQRYAVKGTLSVNFTMMNGQMIGNPEVAYFPTKKFMQNYSNQDKPAHWELEIKQAKGDHMRFTGRYQGTLNYTGAPSEDKPESMDIDVHFDITATPQS